MERRAGVKLNSAHGGMSFSILVGIYMLVSLIVSLIVLRAGIQGSDGAKYMSFLVSPISIAVCLIVVFAGFKTDSREVFNPKCKVKYYVIALMILFGLFFSLGRVNGYIVELLKLCGYKPRPQENIMPSLDGWLILPALLVMAVIPAVCEEFMFRGAILKGCENGAGTVRTIFITGFIFSIFHGSIEQTVYQFICGCLFAFVALRAGSALPTIVIHFLNNALIIIFEAYNLTDAAGNLILPFAAEITLTVLSALSLIGAVIWLILDKKPVVRKEKGGVIKFFLLSSVGVFIMAIIWVLGLFGL